MIYSLVEEKNVDEFIESLNQQFQTTIPCTVLNEDQWHYMPVD